MTPPYRPDSSNVHSMSAGGERPAAPARPWTVRPAGRPARPATPTRRYDVLYQGADGQIDEFTRAAPALPVFEAPFSAFARGALVATPRGEVAIEDLLPGTPVLTRDGPQPVRWIGRLLLPPANLKQDTGPDVYRLASEALGPMKPVPDLVLCSGARVLHHARRLSALTMGTEVLVPVAEFADGVTVTQLTPMSAVTAYHIALDHHAVIEVNGLPVETYHPGEEYPEGLPADLLPLFLSMFPHLRALGDFGPLALPRMGLDQIDALAASA